LALDRVLQVTVFKWYRPRAWSFVGGGSDFSPLPKRCQLGGMFKLEGVRGDQGEGS